MLNFFRIMNFFSTTLSFGIGSLLICTSCSRTTLYGTLTVKYSDSGTYEIYKIANEQPIQFISDTNSSFNEPIHLNPGSYMVMADCSSEIVNIYPGSEITLVAHKVNFMPLKPPTARDKFSIQCIRSEKTKTRQNLVNQYSLAVLAGFREFLVGMIPLRLDLNSKEPNSKNENSRVVSYLLSSISVSASGREPLDDFFVSPVGGITPFTENQRPGSRLYVLPGKYDVQLNGTEMTLDLSDGESRTILPGTLNISTSSNIDISKAEKIRGAPIFAEINGDHHIELNVSYPVLPGTLNIRLATSLRSQKFEISEGEILKIPAHNVFVELGCNPEDWACLGSKKIRLFEKDKNYHFSESQTDVPILFFEKDVSLGIEGSRNVKFNIGTADDTKVRIGFLEVVPAPIHKAGVLTDLMRVEALGGGIYGSSLDMSLDKPTIMPLVTGTYHLSQYSFLTSDGSRHKSSQTINITQGQKVKIEIQTFLSEKRMAIISGDLEDSSKQ